MKRIEGGSASGDLRGLAWPSLPFLVSAQTVGLPAPCAKARDPHLLISCDQPQAGDADVRSSARAERGVERVSALSR